MKKSKTEEVLLNFEETAILEAAKKLKEQALPELKIENLPEPEICSETQSDPEPLERIVGRRNFLPASFLEEGAIVQKAVARLAFRERHNSFDIGDGWATGFMVSPSLFLTNNHVIPNKSFAKKLKIQFNYQLDLSGNPLTVDEFTLNPDEVFHTNAALDYTLISVNGKLNFVNKNNFVNVSEQLADELTPNPLDPIDFVGPVDLKNRIDIDKNRFGNWRLNWFFIHAGNRHGYIKLRKSIGYNISSFLNIIQHPSARRKEVALQENTITNIYTNKIRYTTDTEPGSSGSPVFDNNWDLMALHHAGGERQNGVWISNQGIRIDKISEDLQNHYKGTSTGRKILTSLGI